MKIIFSFQSFLKAKKIISFRKNNDFKKRIFLCIKYALSSKKIVNNCNIGCFFYFQNLVIFCINIFVVVNLVYSKKYVLFIIFRFKKLIKISFF
ncbi:hypothetical protein PA0706 [Candidatus Phytoplasma australiense]|uniref:Uncharacterized protein n=2 Tax=Phytoplasma australiense TaxID=59748 RepID=B1VAR7_PHYAS|nr:Hypothetical Protein SLY_0539 [Strawberry lethal yellows phytoplasma (CPA) str. NZSb11]CAM12040.1 hypothetical protein PA0706 [Candidatus Phytoplasma australiense]